jgi:hypothetical protein
MESSLVIHENYWRVIEIFLFYPLEMGQETGLYYMPLLSQLFTETIS